MSILSRIKISPQQRFDLEDFVADQSARRTDSKLWTQKFLSEDNLILSGFTVTGVGLTSANVAMTDCALIIPQGSTDFSYFVSSPSESDLTIPDSDLVDGARNYVEIALATQDGTPLTKAFWDPDANSGSGSEFNQIVNTITDLKVTLVSSTGGFSGSQDQIPLCIIDTDGSGIIKVILDRRSTYGRLAKPENLDNEYSWGTKVDPTFALNLSGVSGTFVAGETLSIGTETAVCVSGGTTSITFNQPSGINFFNGDSVTGQTSGAMGTVNTVYESFAGVDKSLTGQKSINDALMTEIKKIKDVRFWWQNAAVSLNGLEAFINSVITPVSSGAKVRWNGSVLSITDSSGSPSSSDVLAKIRILGKSSQLSLSRQDGTGGSSTISIADGSMLYVQLPSSGNRTFSGVGSGSTNFIVTPRASFPPSDSNFWLAYREGSKLFFRGNGELQANESAEIGDNVPQTLLDNLGLTDEVTAASYSSDIRGTANQSLVARIGVLTDSLGDQQEDRSGYLRSDNTISWSGTQLSFTSNIILELVNTKTGTLTKHTCSTSNSPITINDQESVWMLIDRTQTNEACSVFRSSVTPIPAQTQVNKDVFILFRRQDVSSVAYLHIPLMKSLMSSGQSLRLGQGASGSTGDIAQTSFSLANNQSSAANVTGLSFANASVRSAEVLYSVVINATTALYEVGSLLLIQRGSDWQLESHYGGDDSRVTFSITSSGQVQYITPNYSGFSSGTMKFRAIVTNV